MPLARNKAEVEARKHLTRKLTSRKIQSKTNRKNLEQLYFWGKY